MTMAQTVPTRVATLYRRGGVLLVEVVDYSTQGMPISSGQVQKLDITASDDDLGRAILSAVASARRDAPHPSSAEDGARLLEPLLRSVGVRTWSAFVRGTRQTTISRVGHILRLSPSINLGPSEGFGSIEEPDLVVESVAAQVLGQIARQAIDRSVPWDGPAAAT